MFSKLRNRTPFNRDLAVQEMMDELTAGIDATLGHKTRVKAELTFLSTPDDKIAYLQEEYNNVVSILKKHDHWERPRLETRQGIVEGVLYFFLDLCPDPHPTTMGGFWENVNSPMFTNLKAICAWSDLADWIASRIKDVHESQELLAAVVALEPLQGIKPIFVAPQARPKLLEALTWYTEESQHSLLELMLKGDSIPTPVIFNGRQNRLAAVFYPYLCDGSISDGAEKVSKWLCENFRRNENGKVVSLSHSTLVKHLKGRDLPS